MLVPNFHGVDPPLSTPRLHRARTARDIQTLKAAATLVPETNRTFSRIERLLVRFEVYGPGAAAPVLRLLNRNGDKMSDWAVTARTSGGHEAEVSLAGVPPGDYLIEIASSTAKALIAFRVTG